MTCTACARCQRRGFEFASFAGDALAAAAPAQGGSAKPVYVKNGRVYHHKVDGGQQMASFTAANASIAAAKAGLAEEHGLGAGGNVRGAGSVLMQTAQRAGRSGGQIGADSASASARGGQAGNGAASVAGGAPLPHFTTVPEFAAGGAGAQASAGDGGEKQWRGPDKGRGGRVLGGRGGRGGRGGEQQRNNGDHAGAHDESQADGHGQGGRDGGRGGFARKTANKAAVGNHHRKERAARKQGGL